ncbi:MAG: alpha/beta hydrolase [Actinomycetota bacterium]|nr:alpha/beta hydrolase [Actinomycetota bacterium]
MTLQVQRHGEGPAVVVVPGALRRATDYVELGEALGALGWQACVVERRGRPGSPARLPGEGIERECDDLSRVCQEVAAVATVGHSFGALICLESAARGVIDLPMALYEPGVSVGGSIPADWVDRYVELLGLGRRRTAFAHFVRHSTGSPPFVRHLPVWYLTAVLRVALRREWPRLDTLLEVSGEEHRLVAACDDRVSAYRTISAPVLLLGGAKSPPALVRIPFAALEQHLPHVHSVVLPGLDHFAPDDKAPVVVAAEVDAFLRRVC